MKIVYVVNKTDYFISHRQALACAAIANGHDVFLVSPDQGEPGKLAKEIKLIKWQLTRSGTGVAAELSSLWSLARIYRQLQPNLVHHVTIKPVIYGGLITRFFPRIKVISAITGMGYVFSGTDLRRRVLQVLIGGLYRLALRRSNHKVIFQNHDDKNYFVTRSWTRPEQARIILGAGVCPERYPFLPEPKSGPTVVMLPARLLKDKGVYEFVAAARILKNNNNISWVLVGDIDQGNPSSISAAELKAWQAEGIIEWWGWCADMVSVFKRCHIVCLPSYREGLPRVLIEAASCGRAIITTDVPGCREIVSHGENGLLVPPQNEQALADAITNLAKQPKLREKMRHNGREKVKNSLSEQQVIAATMACYQD